MLSCKDFLTWLNDYLDECTDPETRRRLEAHVTQCPNCYVIFDTTRKTIAVYKGMDPQPIPADVHERLMQALEKKLAGGGCPGEPKPGGRPPTA